LSAENHYSWEKVKKSKSQGTKLAKKGSKCPGVRDLKRAMPKISTEFIAIGANRTTHAAAWGVEGLVAFGADKLVALYNPLDKTSKGVFETLPGHSDRVICMEFIERGHGVDMKDVAMVSGSADKTARVWKKNSKGEWIHAATLEGHTGAVEVVTCMRAQSIDVDTDLIITGSADGTIRVWERRVANDTSDEVTCLQVINCGSVYPMSLALSYLPESKVPILASGHTDKKINIYIYQHGKREFVKLHTLHGHDNWVRSLAFATNTESESHVDSHNILRSGDLMLASASQDKYIRLWKISPQKAARAKETQVKENSNSSNELLEALLSGQDEQLSTKAHLIEVDDESGLPEKHQYTIMFDALLMGHDDWVYSVAWQRPQLVTDARGISRLVQPSRLISASSDKSMMVWSPDPSTGVWVNEVRMGDIGGNSYLGFIGALFSPDGKHVLSHGANGSFHLWKDISTDEEGSRWTPEVSISGHFKSVENVAWDPKCRYLVSASLDQTTRLFAPWCHDVDGMKVSTWHEMGRPQVHGYDLKCIAFVHDWQFVSGADEKVLRVFDAPKSCVANLAALTGEKELVGQIVGAGFLGYREHNVESRPVGANLPALGLSNKAVFEADIDAMANTEENHTTLQSYASASSTPTSLREVMEHPPFEEHLLQHTLWPEVEKLYGHGYEIISAEATHDGRYIATACKAASPEHAAVRLFDTSNWKEVKTKIAAHTLTVTRVRFSHDDRWLLTVSRDRVWSISERVHGDDDIAYRLVSKNKSHARIIWDCSWSHDDKFFVTGSRDKTVKVWSVEQNWACVATIKCDEAVTAIDCAPILVNGRYIIAVGLENGQIEFLCAAQIDAWELWYKVEERLCHVGVVRSLAWRKPSDEVKHLQLASAGEDHSVRIFNVENE
ncbi:Elongator subunit elp2, partial [Apophysomyces ossiformis]